MATIWTPGGLPGLVIGRTGYQSFYARGNPPVVIKTFFSARPFCEDFAAVADTGNGSWYYLRPDWSETFPGKRFDVANDFSGGRALVYVDLHFFFIGRDGKKDFFGIFDDATPFWRGRARVSQGGEWFDINTFGNEIPGTRGDRFRTYEEMRRSIPCGFRSSCAFCPRCTRQQQAMAG